jgi:hypothetical protein
MVDKYMEQNAAVGMSIGNRTNTHVNNLLHNGYRLFSQKFLSLMAFS